MQESRLFKMVYYLLEKGKSTAPELSRKFEVSVRTIYRDIDTLSSAGIPIYATQGKGGGISILDHFVLNKSLFSEEEQDQILMALQGIAATEGKNSNELLTKLGSLFQAKAVNWIEVDFSNWIKNGPDENIFNAVKEAIFNKKVIAFRYFSSSGEMTYRRVQPVKLIFKNKDWYLYAFCLLNNKYRFFKLTRIKELELLSETFLQEFTSPVIEKEIKQEKTITVTLRFKKQMAFRVYDEFTESITEDQQGHLYVQTELPDNEMLYCYIFSFLDCAEVIEPPSVRENIKKKLEDMQKNYIT